MLSLYWARIRGKPSLSFLVYFSLMIIPSLKRDPRGQDQLDHHSNLLTCSRAPEAQFRQMEKKWRSLECSWSSPGQGRQTACALGGQRAKCAHALAGACSIFAMVIISSSSPSSNAIINHLWTSILPPHCVQLCQWVLTLSMSVCPNVSSSTVFVLKPTTWVNRVPPIVSIGDVTNPLSLDQSPLDCPEIYNHFLIQPQQKEVLYVMKMQTTYNFSATKYNKEECFNPAFTLISSSIGQTPPSFRAFQRNQIKSQADQIDTNTSWGWGQTSWETNQRNQCQQIRGTNSNSRRNKLI